MKRDVMEFFGILFLIIAIVLVAFQIATFIKSYSTSLFLIAVITTLSLACAILALVGDREITKWCAGGIAFLPCIALIITMAHQLLTDSNNLGAGEYGIMIFYLIIFAIYGIVGVSARGDN